MVVSKVKSITGTNVWKSTNWDVFYHSMEMENGDKVSIGKKTDNYFKVWDEIKYEVKETDQYGVKKIKEIREEFKKGWYTPVNPRIQAVSMAMAYSKDLVVAGKVDVKDIKSSATSIFNWMLETINALEIVTK